MMYDFHKLLKPYDIVDVKHDGYSHLGEIISKPADGKVMCRMVPGDPTTMVEINQGMIIGVGCCKPKWVHYAEINGSGQFPVDMLRYDRCAPANFKLVKEDGEWGRITAELNEGEDLLVVAKATEHKIGNHWTEGRWNSFLWMVKHIKTVKMGELE